MFHALYEFCSRFRRDRSGNFAMLFSLAAPLILVAGGVAIDFSHAVSEQAKMQAALDAAVLEGVKVASSSTQAAGVTAARNMFYANLAWSGPTPTFSFSGSALNGTATYAMPTMFAGYVGHDTLNLDVASNAAAGSAPSYPACILLLSTTAQGLTVNQHANLQAPKCQIDVASTSNPAMMMNTSSTINAAETCVAGSNVTNNGGTINNLVKSCGVPSNPFLGQLPAPASTTCSGSLANGGTYSGTLTLSPGVYCGYFNFNGATNVTLNPGVYVIKSGGWNVNGGNWTGSGVTFYFADSSGIQFNSGMSLTLSAPTTGTYAGILMYENDSTAGSQNYTTNFIFDNSVSESLSGFIYLPKRNITFNSTSNETTPNMSVVALTAIFDTMNWSLTPNTTWVIPASGSSSSTMATLSQ